MTGTCFLIQKASSLITGTSFQLLSLSINSTVASFLYKWDTDLQHQLRILRKVIYGSSTQPRCYSAVGKLHLIIAFDIEWSNLPTYCYWPMIQSKHFVVQCKHLCKVPGYRTWWYMFDLLCRGRPPPPPVPYPSKPTLTTVALDYGQWAISLGLLYAGNRALAGATASAGIAFPSPLIGMLFFLSQFDQGEALITMEAFRIFARGLIKCLIDYACHS